MMKIFVCSPYGGKPENLEKARDICGKLIRDGHVPFAPHLLFTQFLDESEPHERQLGIEAGLALMTVCDEVRFYVDAEKRKSAGMLIEEAEAKRLNKPRKYIVMGSA
jgi:hypothetical protein